MSPTPLIFKVTRHKRRAMQSGEVAELSPTLQFLLSMKTHVNPKKSEKMSLLKITIIQIVPFFLWIFFLSLVCMFVTVFIYCQFNTIGSPNQSTETRCSRRSPSTRSSAAKGWSRRSFSSSKR